MYIFDKLLRIIQIVNLFPIISFFKSIYFFNKLIDCS